MTANRRASAFVVVSAIAAVTTWSVFPLAGQTCDPANSTGSRGFVSWVRFTSAAPRRAVIREDIHLPAVDSDKVIPVQSDSLCRRALELARTAPAVNSVQIRLTRVGDVYVAELVGPHPGSEWTRIFVMDTLFRSILGATGR